MGSNFPHESLYPKAGMLNAEGCCHNFDELLSLWVSWIVHM